MIKIRVAAEEDVDKIVSLESQWKESYPVWGRDGILAEFKKDNSFTFVAELEGEIVGFVNFWVFDELIEINSVVVSKYFLRRGVGKGLIESVYSFAKERGIRRIILEVNEMNKPAIELYKKVGFCVYNRRKKYYDCKYDGLMMELIL